MRTLGTQVRVKRLVRLQGELAGRLAEPETDVRLRAIATRRLVEAVADVRAAWAADLVVAPPGPARDELRRHVSGTLSRLEVLAATIQRPGSDVVALGLEFRHTAVPLLFFLRGVEDTSDQALLAWLAPQPLSRTA